MSQVEPKIDKNHPFEDAANRLHEKGFRRDRLAEWDERWKLLTPKARLAFLDHLKGPDPEKAAKQPSVSVVSIEGSNLAELIGAGFAELGGKGGGQGIGRVFVPIAARDFASRTRALRRNRLLSGGKLPEQLINHIRYSYIPEAITKTLRDVLDRAKIGFARDDEAIATYVVQALWLVWSLECIDDPVAKRIAEVLSKAETPKTFDELKRRLHEADQPKAREALDLLIARFVVFEDLRPQTFEIVFGVLNQVRQGLDQPSIPDSRRPELIEVPHPVALGPEDGWIVADLRAFLLEIAAESPKIRNDGGIFQKEIDRFIEALAPIPPWLDRAREKDSRFRRFSEAHRRAIDLNLVEIVVEDSRSRMELSKAGKEWLSADAARQREIVYELYDGRNTKDSIIFIYHGFKGMNTWNIGGYSDEGPRFYGIQFAVVPWSSKNRRDSVTVTHADRQALRHEFEKAIGSLPLGKFFTFESVLSYLAYGPENPLTKRFLGKEALILAEFPERTPDAAGPVDLSKQLIRVFFEYRLLPLGCFQAGIDERDQVVIARRPRFAAYFGKKIAEDELAKGASAVPSKVIVQPDFSIVIIGVDPTPAIELAPFCDRAKGQAGLAAGATVLKITRDSIVKAIANGLEPLQVIERLKKHAFNELPPNVAKEIKHWTEWTKRATVESMTVINCPDREAADRVAACLGKRGRRISDLLVGIESRALPAADRVKLKSQGVLIENKVAPRTSRGGFGHERRAYRDYDDDW